ncbi:MAG TPA: VanZ family protein [Verrucomicrobiae bacterium]|nr:VanZ family protein [Verrucomicrobiae bacterium]
MRRARWALLTFAVFVFVLIWLADSGRARWLFDLVRLVPGGDKTGHFVLFGWLSFLLNLVLRASTVRFGRLTLLKGSLIVGVFAIVEEVSQLFFAARTFDLRDLAAGLLGIGLLGRIATRFPKPEPALVGRSLHRPHGKR